MKSFIRKSIGAFVFLGLFGVAHAARPGGSVVPFNIGITTTTGLQVYTGAGWLYNVVVSSGVVGSYVTCIDSTNTITGTTAGTSANPVLAQLSIGISSMSTQGMPAGFPPVGFSNGVNCAPTGASNSTIYYLPQ